jgi:hypothetical protein
MALITTDGLEGALREILETVQRQSIEIANLRAEVGQHATRGEVAELSRALGARLGALEGRVERLEEETCLSIPLEVLMDAAPESEGGSGGGASGASSGSARVPLSRYVAAHHAHLRLLHQRAHEALATRGELAAARSEAAEAVAGLAARVAEERAPREALAALSGAMGSVQEELTAAQGVLATKADRSDLARAGALLADLSSYAAFKASAGAELRELGVRTEEHRSALDRSLESVAKLSAVVQALAGSCAGKADAREVGALGAALERLGGDVARRALGEDVRALSAAVSGAAGRAAGLEAGAREAARTGAEERRALEARVGGLVAAARSDAAGAVAALRAEVDAVRQDVEARAYVTSLEATDETVAELSERLELAHRKTDVALRFVDWVRLRPPPPPPRCSTRKRGKRTSTMRALWSGT